MRRFMIDIETLGTEPGCAVIQVGAVQMGDDYAPLPGTDFQENVLWKGDGFGEIDPGTLRWWLQQDERARSMVFSQVHAKKPARVCAELVDYLRDADELWADGPQFDLLHLRMMFKRCGVAWPWSHRVERCFRTLKRISGVEPNPFMGVPHIALDDALNQSWHLAKIMRQLGS